MIESCVCVCVVFFFPPYTEIAPWDTWRSTYKQDDDGYKHIPFVYTLFPFLEDAFFYPLDTFCFSSCSLLDKIHTTHRLSKPCASCHKLFAKHFSTRLRMQEKRKENPTYFYIEHIECMCGYGKRIYSMFSKNFRPNYEEKSAKAEKYLWCGTVRFYRIWSYSIVNKVFWYKFIFWANWDEKNAHKKPCNKYKRVFLYLSLMAYFISNENWAWTKDIKVKNADFLYLILNSLQGNYSYIISYSTI